MSADRENPRNNHPHGFPTPATDDDGIAAWMANAIASDGVLFEVREQVDVMLGSEVSYVVEWAKLLLRLLDTQRERVDRLRARAGLSSIDAAAPTPPSTVSS